MLSEDTDNNELSYSKVETIFGTYNEKRGPRESNTHRTYIRKKKQEKMNNLTCLFGWVQNKNKEE